MASSQVLISSLMVFSRHVFGKDWLHLKFWVWKPIRWCLSCANFGKPPLSETWFLHLKGCNHNSRKHTCAHVHAHTYMCSHAEARSTHTLDDSSVTDTQVRWSHWCLSSNPDPDTYQLWFYESCWIILFLCLACNLELWSRIKRFIYVKYLKR